MPEELEDSLPSIEQIEHKLSQIVDKDEKHTAS